MTTKIPIFASNETAVKLDSERKVLIDGDIFRYQMGAIQMRHPFLDELIPADSSVITRMVDDLIVSICEACSGHRLHLSSYPFYIIKWYLNETKEWH